MINFNLDKIPTPSLEDLVEIRYNPGVYMWKHTYTRWSLQNDRLVRDYQGEEEWRQMASYVDKTYAEVFEDEYNYSLDSKKS